MIPMPDILWQQVRLSNLSRRDNFPQSSHERFLAMTTICARSPEILIRIVVLGDKGAQFHSHHTEQLLCA